MCLLGPIEFEECNTAVATEGEFLLKVFKEYILTNLFSSSILKQGKNVVNIPTNPKFEEEHIFIFI